MNRTLLVSLLVAVGASAQATLINFDNLSVGTTLANQYTGVHFAAGADGVAITGATGSLATNTDLTIVAVGGGDTGGLGTPSLVSGMIVRSFNGWLSEDGDPVLNIKFDDNISAISMDFAGVATPASTIIRAVDAGKNIVATATGSTTGQFTLSLAGLTGVKEVIVTPGDFFDWVGFDNLNYTTQSVPEPATLALLGLAVPFIARRRKNR